MRGVVLGNEVLDANPLAGLTGLRGLSLSNNRISNIDFVANMNDLEALIVAGIPIGNASILANKPNLELLNARDTGLSTLAPLASSTLLRDLDRRISVEQVADDLSALADAILRISMRWCWPLLRQRHREQPPRRR